MTVYEWSLIGIAGSWLIRLTMIPVVVTQKESPSTSLAWLMIVFFEPWIGLGLYVLLGQDRLVRRRLRLRSLARRFQSPVSPDVAAEAVRSRPTAKPLPRAELTSLNCSGSRRAHKKAAGGDGIPQRTVVLLRARGATRHGNRSSDSSPPTDRRVPTIHISEAEQVANWNGRFKSSR